MKHSGGELEAAEKQNNNMKTQFFYDAIIINCDAPFCSDLKQKLSDCIIENSRLIKDYIIVITSDK